MYKYSSIGFTFISDTPILKLEPTPFINYDKIIYIKSFLNFSPPELKNCLFSNNYFSGNEEAFILKAFDFKFYFSKKENILYTSNITTNQDLFEQYLTGPVFALISFYHNRIPFHASGILLNNKPILILGSSGAGKSSLSYHLITTYKASFFSDDLVCIENNPYCAIPSFAEIKLWKDAVDRYQIVNVRPVRNNVNKFIFNVQQYFNQQIQKPYHWYILKTTPYETPSIEEITGINKYLKILPFIYRKSIILHLFPKMVFEKVSQITKYIKLYEIKRPLKNHDLSWHQFIENNIVNDH